MTQLHDNPGDYADLQIASDAIIEFDIQPTGFCATVRRTIGQYLSRVFTMGSIPENNNVGFIFSTIPNEYSDIHIRRRSSSCTTTGCSVSSEGDANSTTTSIPDNKTDNTSDERDMKSPNAVMDVIPTFCSVGKIKYRRLSGFLYPCSDHKRIEGEYLQYISDNIHAQVTGISSQKKGASHLNAFLFYYAPTWSGKVMYTTDESTMGVSTLVNVSSKVDVGAEVFYAASQSSGGLSLGCRYLSKRPGSGLLTAMTGIINPVMGHIHGTYSEEVRHDLSMSTKFEYNVHNNEADVSAGIAYTPDDSPYIVRAAAGTAKGLSLLLEAAGEHVSFIVSCSSKLKPSSDVKPTLGFEIILNNLGMSNNAF